ncbi:unnamed protein product [Acidocella sp. C78]|nr:unnamed protein product [Acidocella sp. C78]
MGLARVGRAKHRLHTRGESGHEPSLAFPPANARRNPPRGDCRTATPPLSRGARSAP